MRRIQMDTGSILLSNGSSDKLIFHRSTDVTLSHAPHFCRNLLA